MCDCLAKQYQPSSPNRPASNGHRRTPRSRWTCRVPIQVSIQPTPPRAIKKFASRLLLALAVITSPSSCLIHPSSTRESEACPFHHSIRERGLLPREGRIVRKGKVSEMAPLKLYGMMLSPNVARVATALNELGLEFEVVPVDLRTGAHKQPEFLALNPFGQIPALQDGDEVLYESRAINRYLATKYKSEGVPDLVPVPSAKLEVWLEVESHHFYPAVSPLVFQLLIKPMLGGAPDAAVVDKHADALAKLLDVYDAHLARNRYLAGDAFSLADLNHMAYLLCLSKTAKAGLIAERPHVTAWWEDIAARPAFQKTVAAIPFPPSA